MSALVPRARSGKATPSIAPTEVIWGVFAALCVVYAVFAFQYFLGFDTAHGVWWSHFQAMVVGSEFSFGAGSVHVEQAAPYAAGRWALRAHTMMGAVAMALGPFQLSRRFRAKRPALHRTLGKVYLLSILLCMAGAIAYLSSTAATDVYSGVAFAAGLWALDGLVLLSAILAYVAIRNGDVARHSALMALNFGLLLTTPVLRLEWLLLGNLTGLNQLEVNLGVTATLIPLSILFALIWRTHATAPRRRPVPA